MTMNLNADEIERYSRQLILPGWGASEQLHLRELSAYSSACFEACLRYLLGAGLGTLYLPSKCADCLEALRSLNPLANVAVLPENVENVDLVIDSSDSPSKVVAPVTLRITPAGCELRTPRAEQQLSLSGGPLAVEAAGSALVLRSLFRTKEH